MPVCGRPECRCQQSFDEAYREFFRVWEGALTTAEERDLTLAAQTATGINYLEVMVDKPSDT